MAYCKNCGSILQSNANFCHVCGTKVDISDVFDEPRTEEVHEEAPKENFGYQNGNSGAEFRGYYDAFRTINSEDGSVAQPEPGKKAFVPGLISMIGSVAVGVEALFNWLYTILIYNYSYEKGTISYTDYASGVTSGLLTSGIYLIFSFILGVTLGVIGIIVSRRYQSKKGFIFSIIGLSVAAVALVGAIIFFVLRSQMLA